MSVEASEAARGRVLIIGGGPAGLTAAFELQQAGLEVSVFEKDGRVGGISRTDQYKGYRYDIGGHRFFSKSKIVNDWWEMMLGGEFLKRPRLSRIFYSGKFFDYPLKASNALFGLGMLEAIRCALSYAHARAFPVKEEKNLEQWVSNRFGKRLFTIFFKTYTEKVWGMPCSEISADWAAQRIKNLNLLVAVRNALFGNLLSRGQVITSLIDEFKYPRLGPGQMWERVAERLAEGGAPVRMHTQVKHIHHEGGRAVAVTVVDEHGQEHYEAGTEIIASLPLGELVRALTPAAPPEVLHAANSLRYRDFLTVGLIIDSADTFPDNWIYVHSPNVKVGRIQNFRSWSPHMIPDEKHSSLGLEYFVQEGDEIWSMPDEDLVALGRHEMAELGLVKPEQVRDGCVIRMPKAYPVYDDHYKGHVLKIREHLEKVAPNLQAVGRNGQHRYNNQDHSMLTAIYASRNILGIKEPGMTKPYDIWQVNTESDYHEEGAKAQPNEPREGSRERLSPGEMDPRTQAVLETLGRFDAVALGVSGSVNVGLALFAATAILLLKGGAVVGPNLALLSNYFVGFEVTWLGAIVILLEGGAVGFAVGFGIATLMNWLVASYERRLIRIVELQNALDLASGD
jgi:protoporphyrinogen oxidase